jgi:hypothetical protein
MCPRTSLGATCSDLSLVEKFWGDGVGFCVDNDARHSVYVNQWYISA